MSSVHVRLDAELHDWIKKEFPHGFIQLFFNECAENLRIMVEEGRMPAPSEYARRAAIDTVATFTRPQTEEEDER